jgi:hypothetical protein
VRGHQAALSLVSGLRGDLDDLLGEWQVQLGEDVDLGLGRLGGLAEGAVGAGEGDGVQPLRRA